MAAFLANATPLAYTRRALISGGAASRPLRWDDKPEARPSPRPDRGFVRRHRAAEVLRAVQAEAAGVVSTQVLQEAYVAGTTKLRVAPLDKKEALKAIAVLETGQVDAGLMESAIDRSILSRISFRDALIVAAVERAKCSELRTEDLNDRQTLRSIRIHNPFRP